MHKVELRHLIARMEAHKSIIKERNLVEAYRKEQKKEAERVRLYNSPLPNFPPKLPASVREKFLSYLKTVVDDAGCATADSLNVSIWNDADKYWMDDADVRQMLYSWKKIPPACLFSAFRISALLSGKIMVRLYVVMEDGMGFTNYISGRFERSIKNRIRYRLKNNLLRNVPELATLLSCAQIDDVCVRVGRRESCIAEIEKSGFLYFGEDKVIHLEFLY
jgi:hypothetical protein